MGLERKIRSKERGGGKWVLTANGMAFDLLGEFLQHVDFAFARLAPFESLHDLLRPLAAFATWRALPATLVLVEARQAGNRAHDVGAFVHHYYRRRAKPRLTVLEGVEVHQLRVASAFGENGGGRATRDDCF